MTSERDREKVRRWQREHKERIRERATKWRSEHREQYNERARRYRAERKEPAILVYPQEVIEKLPPEKVLKELGFYEEE